MMMVMIMIAKVTCVIACFFAIGAFYAPIYPPTVAAAANYTPRGIM